MSRDRYEKVTRVRETTATSVLRALTTVPEVSYRLRWKRSDGESFSELIRATRCGVQKGNAWHASRGLRRRR